MVRYCFSLYYRYHVCRTFLGLNVCDWSNSMKLWYVLAVRIQGRILENYIATNLKRVPYVIVNFEQIHTALFRVQKTACASYHCCCCLDSRQCRKVKKREFNQSFQPGKCFHQLCFAPSSFLSLLLPCQVQDGQEKTKNKVLPKLYASLTVIASCHSMLYHILGGIFILCKF